MKIYTIGFTKKSAEAFFEKLKENKVSKIIDIRLNNASQLAGFSKNNDLKYFLRQILDIDYSHEINLAPTKDILDDYKRKTITWDEYKKKYIEILEKRNIKERISITDYDQCCFLCSEELPEFCHRILLTEYIGEIIELEVKHL